MGTVVLSPTSYWWTTFFHEENRKWKGKKSKVCSKCFSYVRLFATPWTVTCEASLSMGILQATVLEWVAMPSSKGSSRPRGQTRVSYSFCNGRWVLYHWLHLGRRFSSLLPDLFLSSKTGSHFLSF